MPNIQVFDFLAGPIGFAQELQARFDAWIMGEAIDGDSVSKFSPAVIFYQIGQNFLEGDPMQGIISLSFIHEMIDFTSLVY